MVRFGAQKLWCLPPKMAKPSQTHCLLQNGIPWPHFFPQNGGLPILWRKWQGEYSIFFLAVAGIKSPMNMLLTFINSQSRRLTSWTSLKQLANDQDPTIPGTLEVRVYYIHLLFFSGKTMEKKRKKHDIGPSLSLSLLLFRLSFDAASCRRPYGGLCPRDKFWICMLAFECERVSPSLFNIFCTHTVS